MISFLWKGCSAILLKLDKLNVLIDPGNIFSLEELERLLDDEGLNIVMYTHEHSGHFDLALLREIVDKYNPYIIANKGVFRLIRRLTDRDKVIKLRGGEMAALLDTRIHALRAVHPGVHPLVFLIEHGSKAVFHGDSTGFSHAFEAFSPVDLAFIPVGSPSPNASPNEAIRIIRALAPKVVVPIHGTTEEIADAEHKVRRAGFDIKVVKPEEGKFINIEI